MLKNRFKICIKCCIFFINETEVIYVCLEEFSGVKCLNLNCFYKTMAFVSLSDFFCGYGKCPIIMNSVWVKAEYFNGFLLNFYGFLNGFWTIK